MSDVILRGLLSLTNWYMALIIVNLIWWYT